MLIKLLTGVAAGGLAYALLFPLRAWLVKGGVMDVANERSSHVGVRPRGGGLAIVLVSLAGLVALLAGSRSGTTALAGYGIGAVVVAGVSWMDDLRSLPWALRLPAQIAAAFVLLASGNVFQDVGLPGGGVIHLGWLGAPLTFLWVVGLTNAYNFMDGIDGLAGSQALIAGAGWAILGTLAGLPLVAGLGALIAGGAAGFLGHNWAPARIFMGDVGSAFLGFTLAYLPVAASQARPALAVPGVLLVWPFVADAGLTFLKRLLRGERVFEAHHSHIYQGFVSRGAPHAAVTLGYSGLALAGLAGALAWALAG
jgi:UDP-N-acetylmuramyl pentapeptide phosphotransferase/UDP-N-acetylglucosamine-1-phosphate transferase